MDISWCSPARTRSEHRIRGDPDARRYPVGSGRVRVDTRQDADPDSKQRSGDGDIRCVGGFAADSRRPCIGPDATERRRRQMACACSSQCLVPGSIERAPLPCPPPRAAQPERYRGRSTLVRTAVSTCDPCSCRELAARRRGTPRCRDSGSSAGSRRSEGRPLPQPHRLRDRHNTPCRRSCCHVGSGSRLGGGLSSARPRRRLPGSSAAQQQEPRRRGREGRIHWRGTTSAVQRPVSVGGSWRRRAGTHDHRPMIRPSSLARSVTAGEAAPARRPAR